MGRVPENPTRTRKNTKIPNFIYLKTRPKPGKKMWKPNTNLKKISEPNIWQPDQSLLISEEIKIEVKRIKELKKLRQRLAYSSFACKSGWILLTSLDLWVNLS